jgi:hypothetical protein
MQSIQKIRNFNPQSLTFSDIATNKFGGSFLYLNDANGRVYLQLPKMKTAFKVSVFIPKDKAGKPTGDDPRYSLSLSFYKMDENPKVKKCFEVLSATDEKLLVAGMEHHEDWFPGQYDQYADDDMKMRIAMETLYNPIIKVDKKNKGKYAPTLRVKLPRYDGVFKMEMYDKSDRKTPIVFGTNEEEGQVDIVKYIGKGTSITPIVSMPMLNFVKGYGTGFTLVQAVVEPVKSFLGSCVIDDSDEEDDAVPPPAATGTMVLDSDDEDEDNQEDNVVVDSSDEDEPDELDEPVPEPEPAPAPKKRGGRKKKSKSKS